jgi:hypothetical protein
VNVVAEQRQQRTFSGANTQTLITNTAAAVTAVLQVDDMLPPGIDVEKDKALLLPPPAGRCVPRPAVTSHSTPSNGLVMRLYSGDHVNGHVQGFADAGGW